MLPYCLMVNRSERAAIQVAYQLPPRIGKRLLVGCCWHNRGFGWFAHLAHRIMPDLVVCLGDLSGLPRALEALVIQSFWDMPAGHPVVYVPGNHDSDLAPIVMANKGAHVLLAPRLVELAGLRIWGWADPNRTRWGRHDAYSEKLCRTVAPDTPVGIGPYMAAVHSAPMAPHTLLQIPLVLCGHDHRQHVYHRSATTFVHVGTAGGGGLQRPGKMTAWQAAVVDVKVPSHRLAGLWWVELERGAVSVVASAGPEALDLG